MKKNVLIKGILVLLVITLLAIGFTGCVPTYLYPTTGTVYITIGGYYTYYNYNVYLDSWYNKIGITSGGTFTATGITPGSHTFYVDDTIWNYYYNYDTVWVTAGQTTYLTLYPY
ncbi:MAG: hypothetical protein MUP69_02840 [Candidatus Atribacteria bacterium]|nr:hypothetical protein [Candidatus Atribacteria bacterium]